MRKKTVEKSDFCFSISYVYICNMLLSATLDFMLHAFISKSERFSKNTDYYG